MKEKMLGTREEHGRCRLKVKVEITEVGGKEEGGEAKPLREQRHTYTTSSNS